MAMSMSSQGQLSPTKTICWLQCFS